MYIIGCIIPIGALSILVGNPSLGIQNTHNTAQFKKSIYISISILNNMQFLRNIYKNQFLKKKAPDRSSLDYYREITIDCPNKIECTLLDDNNIYLGVKLSGLYSYSKAGQKNWSIDLDGSIRAMYSKDNTLYALTWEGDVYKIDKTTGKHNKIIKGGGFIDHGFIRGDDKNNIYIGRDKELIKYNLDKHNICWKSETKHKLEDGVITKAFIYTYSGDSIYIFDKLTGSMHGERLFFDPIGIKYDGSRIYRSSSNYCTILDDTANKLAKIKTRRPIKSFDVNDQNLAIYTMSKKINKIIFFDKKTASKLYTLKLKNPVSSIHIDNDSIYLFHNNKVQILHPKNMDPCNKIIQKKDPNFLDLPEEREKAYIYILQNLRNGTLPSNEFFTLASDSFQRAVILENNDKTGNLRQDLIRSSILFACANSKFDLLPGDLGSELDFTIKVIKNSFVEKVKSGEIADKLVVSDYIDKIKPVIEFQSTKEFLNDEVIKNALLTSIQEASFDVVKNVFSLIKDTAPSYLQDSREIIKKREKSYKQLYAQTKDPIYSTLALDFGFLLEE